MVLLTNSRVGYVGYLMATRPVADVVTSLFREAQ